MATLYNLGFRTSKPNADPRAGGSTFQVNGKTFTFGTVAFDFYYSGELLKEFPYWKEKWVSYPGNSTSLKGIATEVE